MNDTISVLTAVPADGHRHLPAAHRSLAEQRLPAGWQWQWVVQSHGRDGSPPLPPLPADSRISADGGRGGGAAARTAALSRATGSLVRVLPADGLLPPGALHRDIETLTRHPEAGWCLSPGLALRPDGPPAGTPLPDPLLPGPLPPGVLAQCLRAGRPGVPAAALTARTELLRALGGWPALPTGADLALLLTCEAVAPGRLGGEPGTIHRVTATEPTEPERAALLARADALLRAGWRWQSPPVLSPYERQAGRSPDPRWAYDRRVEIHQAVDGVLREAADVLARRSRNGRWTPPGEIAEGGSNIGLSTAARVWVLDRLAERIRAARAVLDEVESDSADYRPDDRSTPLLG
ncbi:hypothetical protein ACIGXM_19890 [Kitasatospora sp. NPDC052896]|uniref:hypothetical protein n=1 Tax=Kitasatospora sp. NPDC052896 TaxID=3364061 RepID=UPI0037CC63DA